MCIFKNLYRNERWCRKKEGGVRGFGGGVVTIELFIVLPLSHNAEVLSVIHIVSFVTFISNKNVFCYIL